MTSLKVTLSSLLLLSACASPAPLPKFKDMTSTELLTYNRSVDYLDQVYCSMQVTSGSHIRRNVCQTLRQMVEGGVQSLDTPSSSYSVVYIP